MAGRVSFLYDSGQSTHSMNCLNRSIVGLNQNERGGFMQKILRMLVVAGGCLLSLTGRGAILDSNFNETFFAGVGNELTGIAWAPDGSGRLFITKKAGTITIVQNGSVLGSPFATVSPLFTGGECGLLGICFDPNFMENGYVYVFATVSSGEQQIIR